MALEKSQLERIDEYGRAAYPGAYDVPTYASSAPPSGYGLPGAADFSGVTAKVDSTEQMGVPAPTPAAAPKPGSFAEFVVGEEGRAGGKLDDVKIDAAAELYKATVLGPRLAAKGVTKEMREASIASFDAKLSRFKEDYAKAAAEAGGETKALERGVGETISDTVGDTATGVLGGLAQLVPALGSVLDYGYRGVRGAAQAITSPEYWKAFGAGDPAAMHRAANLGDQTELGRESAQLSDEIAQSTREGLSKRGQQASQSVDDAEGFFGTLGALKRNPAALPGLVGQGVASLAPAGVLKIPKVAAILANATRFGRAATGASIIGGPQALSSTGGFEADLRKLTLNDLLENNPEGQALYDAMRTAYGEDQDIDQKVKDAIINKAVLPVMAANLATDVGLAAIPGFGAESAVSGATARSATRLRGAASGGVTEAAQEALAGAGQQIGQNIGTETAKGGDVPLLAGAGDAAAMGLVPGLAIGGGVGALRNPLRSTPNLPPPDQTVDPATALGLTPDAPAATDVPAPAATDVPPAPAGGGLADNPGAGIPEAALAPILTRAADAAALIATRAKKAVGGLDAAGVLAQASTIAQNTAGDAWANMTALQRLDAVDTAAEALNKLAKKEEVATTLGAMRNTLNAPPVAAAANEAPAPTPVPATPAPEPSAPAPVAPPAPVQAAPAPVPAPPVETTPAPTTDLPTLPAELAKAAPRYGAGPDQWITEFESDVDKALYIAGRSNTLSKADSKYRDWLVGLGFTEQQIANYGKMMVANVAAYAQQTKGGTPKSPAKLRVPASNAMQAVGRPPTNPLASKPKKVAAKKNPLKKADTPPKNEAPVTTPGQASVDPVKQVVTETTNLTGEIAQELMGALELARQGNPTQLNAMLKELQNEGDITPAQARLLRKEGAPQTPAQEGLTEGTDGPSADSEVQIETPALRKLLDDILEAKGTAADLLRAIAKRPEATVYQKWLINKLIPILDGMGTGLGSNIRRGIAHGTYEPTLNRIVINNARISTIVHEALHAATVGTLARKSTDPNVVKLQEGITKLFEYGKRVYKKSDAYEALDSDGRDRVKGAFKNEIELITYALTDPRSQQLFSSIPAPPWSKAENMWGTFKELLLTFYAKAFKPTPLQNSYLNAVIDITAALTDIAEADPAAVATAAQEAFTQGTGAGSPLIYREQFDDSQLYDDTAGQTAAAAPVVPTNVDVTPRTNYQRIVETLAQSAYGLEKSIREILKAGGTVTPENNPYYGARKYQSDIAENRNTDNMEVVQPIENWIAANWQKFRVTTLEEFRTNLDKFLQNYHTLHERNPSVWANNVKLNNGMEVQRELLIADAYDGKITGPQLNAALIKLAQQNAVTQLEEWTKANPSRDPARARKALDEARKLGFTEASLKDFNALMQAARDRSRERMNAAGITSTDDPFADRGWKWYVPLKGSLTTDEESADFDIGSRRGDTKEFRSRNIKVLKGRNTNASNALEQLIVDMNTAATAHAEADFKNTVFQYVLDNQKLLGAEIRRWTGTPKQGYTTQSYFTKSGKLVPYGRGRRTRRGRTGTELHVREINNPRYGFIYNDGTNHYEIRLPQGSQLDLGIKGIRSAVSPMEFEENNNYVASMFRGLGTATNIMARAYTTWSPTWQLMTAFMRDVNALPITVAAEAFDSPWKARVFAKQYAGNLVSNMAATAKGQGEWKALIGDKSAMRAYATANPDSYVAKLLAYREAGGSTEFSQGLNREQAGDLIFGKARKEANPLLSKTGVADKYKKWNELTGNWAAMLENKGRVAAWEALVAGGMDPKQAAAIVKGALDYGQSGEWGKLINIVHAFYRVGATSADTMRRIFTDQKTGKLNKEKARNWGTFMGAAGAAAYMLLAAALGDDEEGKPRIRKYDLNTLTQKMVLPWGEDDSITLSPIGLGLPQLTMAPGIIAAAVSQGHATPKEGTKAMYETVTRNTPVQPAGWREGSGASGFANSWLIGLLAPTPAMPFVESAANTNSFDGPIRTDFPNKDKFASDQGMPDTPAFWKDTADTVREVTGIDMYPETIRHFIKGWGGQPANNVIRWTLDNANKEEQGMDSRAVRTALKLGVNDEDFYYRNESRKALATLSVAKRELKNATDTDGEDEAKFLRANPNIAKRVAAWKELDKARDAYYKRKNAIKLNTLMSPEGKKSELKKADSKLRDATNQAEKIIEATED